MEFLFHLLILTSIFGLLALGLNLIVGFAGLLSVTQAAFFGVGSYTTALLMTTQGMNFFPALVVGMLVSATMAFLISLVLSRFRDDYYALTSLGFNFIVFGVFLNWEEVTRGPLGVAGIPRPEFFGFSFISPVSFLLLSLFFLLLGYAFCRFVERSSFGRALKAIREDEEALQVFGYFTPSYKLLVFVFGALLASLAGSLFASYVSFIDATAFQFTESVLILAMIILGGLGNIKGSLLGAAFLVMLPEFLRFLGFPAEVSAHARVALYGLLLILLMMFRPQGLLGTYKL